MIYRENDWKIYACQYVMTTEIEGDANSRQTYIKVVLYHAASPEQAYEKAQFGVSVNLERYKDEKGDVVSFRCLGILDIDLLQDTWQEIQEQTEDDYGYDLCDVRGPVFSGPELLISEKNQLSIFQ